MENKWIPSCPNSIDHSWYTALDAVPEMLVLLVSEILETLHCLLCRIRPIQKAFPLLVSIFKEAIAGVNNLKTHRSRV